MRSAKKQMANSQNAVFQKNKWLTAIDFLENVDFCADTAPNYHITFFYVFLW
jgi:hypothetical protein